jgi:hypothetical protein
MTNYKSKYLILLLGLFLLQRQFSFSQSLTIDINSTTFHVGSTTSIENNSTIVSSFTLTVNSGPRNYNLYAGVSDKSFSPSTTAFPSVPLSINLTGISGTATTGGVSGNLQLENYPPTYVVLANNATRTGIFGTAVWTYNLSLSAPGYAIAPGTYVFTLSVQYSDDRNNIIKQFPVTINVQPVVSLELTANTSTNVTFASSNNYLNGITASNFNTLAVKANLPWQVNVSSQNSYFTPASSGADAIMPCSVIAFKASTNSSFLPLSTTAQVLKTGLPGTVHSSGNTFNMDMHFSPGYNYSAGIYNIPLTYTITGQ